MKISVVVPLYNSEEYIDRCVKSIIEQSYTNWELFLIDDGSKDNSYEIIKNFEKNDSRIVALHQENMGAGLARNKGLKLVTGDYVVFIDSDDYIEKDYFSLLVELAEYNDVVFIDDEQVREDGSKIKSEYMSVYGRYSKEKLLRCQLTGKIPWGGWRKAVSARLLKDNNIQYTSHKNGEEALYSFRVLQAAKNVAFLDKKPVYYYVNRENSLSKSVNLDPWGDVVETIADYLKESGQYQKYANTINAFCFTATIVSIDKITKYCSKKNLEINIQNRMEKFKKTYDSEFGIDYRSMSLKALPFVPCLKMNFVLPIVFCSIIRKSL